MEGCKSLSTFACNEWIAKANIWPPQASGRVQLWTSQSRCCEFDTFQLVQTKQKNWLSFDLFQYIFQNNILFWVRFYVRCPTWSNMEESTLSGNVKTTNKSWFSFNSESTMLCFVAVTAVKATIKQDCKDFNLREKTNSTSHGFTITVILRWLRHKSFGM